MASKRVDTLLSSVLEVKHGYAFPGENIRDAPPGDILMTPGNFAIGGGFKGEKFKYFDGDIPEDYVLRENDLVVTMTDLSKQADTLGYPAFVPKLNGHRILHNQRIGKVLIKEGAQVDKKYIYYLLRTTEYRNEVLASATGTTVKHTSPKRILAYKASIPVLTEQKSIAAVLWALDEKIESNRQINISLEAMGRALYQSWFVDFDPVRAKSEGRKVTGIDDAASVLIPSAFTDSCLGKIPKGWRVGTLADCATISRATIDPGDYPSETFHHFSLPAFDAGQYPTVEKGSEIKSSKFIVPSSAFLLSKLNPRIPRVWVPDLSEAERPVCSTEFIVLQPKIADGGREYLYGVITSFDFLQSMASRVTGTSGSHQRVRPDDCMAIACVLPDQSFIRQFSILVKPLIQRMDCNRREMKILSITRDALLPKLLSGEIPADRTEGVAHV